MNEYNNGGKNLTVKQDVMKLKFQSGIIQSVDFRQTALVQTCISSAASLVDCSK